jgi:broad specificity phosphatase PhoE
MKPRRIILIRHGQSEGNVDRGIYATKPDYALLLSETGIEQGRAAGKALLDVIGPGKWLGETSPEKTFFYVSPLFRTRQTFEEIAKSFPDKADIHYREDPRLREQEWGHLKSTDSCETIDSDRDSYGPFYYRIPDGESAADVYDRVSDFCATMYRDFEKADFPENAVLIIHGMTIRLFLMRWFHYTVEDFESMRNPDNCKIVVLDRTDFGGVEIDGAMPMNNKYSLMTHMEKYETPSHAYQRPINLNN